MSSWYPSIESTSLGRWYSAAELRMECERTSYRLRRLAADLIHKESGQARDELSQERSGHEARDDGSGL